MGRTLLSFAVLAALSGCLTHHERHEPYDSRALLAHPSMNPAALSFGQDSRVYAITEGAHGDASPEKATASGDVVITPR